VAAVNDLEVAAHRLTSPDRHGLGVRVDGYWFLAFLRASGGEMLDPVTGSTRIDRPDRGRLTRIANVIALPGVGQRAADPGHRRRARNPQSVLRVLEACGGQKTRAAAVLGINRTTLWKKLRHYGLE
jgi:hypothetical protein